MFPVSFRLFTMIVSHPDILPHELYGARLYFASNSDAAKS
jgi:hypothetical protein